MLSESTMVHGGPIVHEITNGLDKRTNIVNNRERDSNNREQSWTIVNSREQSWTVVNGTINLNNYSKNNNQPNNGNNIYLKKYSHNGGNQMVKCWPSNYLTIKHTMITKPTPWQQVSQYEQRYQFFVVIALTLLLRKTNGTLILAPSFVSLSWHHLWTK